MQHITVTLEDQDYQAFSRAALRLNQSVDTYVSALLMAQIGTRGTDVNSAIQSGIGLFADAPELVDAVLANIMESRARRWQHPDDASHS